MEWNELELELGDYLSFLSLSEVSMGFFHSLLGLFIQAFVGIFASIELSHDENSLGGGWDERETWDGFYGGRRWSDGDWTLM